MSNTPDWLTSLHQTLGDGGLLIPGVNATADDLAPHLTDWRGRYTGRTLAMARPGSTPEVVRVVQACAAHGVSLVPQGGNTSLVGGSVPDGSGQQLLLSLQRMNHIRSVDIDNFSLSAEAGCTLHAVQNAASAQQLLFPLSLASEGSCTIGGNLATNAGGTQVLRYGTARELCMGLEVVTADGQVMHGLSSLRKDNTGYDLRDLFIGSEGTLGIITCASLKLFPQPQGSACALVSCPDIHHCVRVLTRARHALGATLVGCEAMAQLPLSLVAKHMPTVSAPLQSLASGGTLPPWVMLLDVHSHGTHAEAQQTLNLMLQAALEAGEILQATVATQAQQHRAMWHVRECIPLAERQEGLMVKHDIAVPTSAIPAFVAQCGQSIRARWPHARVVCFGHLGDGNLHYNVQPPAELSAQAMASFEHDINTVVFDQVQALGGTLSAEHGIGALRRDELSRRKDPVSLALMQSIKRSLDPQNILNPGRVLPSLPG